VSFEKKYKLVHIIWITDTEGLVYGEGSKACHILEVDDGKVNARLYSPFKRNVCSDRTTGGVTNGKKAFIVDNREDLYTNTLIGNDLRVRRIRII